MDNIIRLNLGCGRNTLEGWINIDWVKLDDVDVVADLDDCSNKKLPFEDNCVDEFFGSHVFEHLKNPLSLMEELHRIAKPNAKITFRVPYGSSDDAYEDPTHVRQCFLNTFEYFSQPFYWRADYGYRGDWKTNAIFLYVDKDKYNGVSDNEVMSDIHSYRNIVSEMVVELIAIKPIREPKRELQIRPQVNIVKV